MILGSGLTQAEQYAFDRLLRFFEGERNAERKALALAPMLAVRCRCGRARSTEELVMSILADCYTDPEVEYLFGERRDNRRER